MPYKISEVVHPLYREHSAGSNYAVYDVAIVKLAAQIRYSFYVYARPICLPNPRITHQSGFGIVAGWGKTSYKGQQSGI